MAHLLRHYTMTVRIVKGIMIMAPEENKAIVRRFFEQAWSQGDLSIVDELIATDADNVSPDEMPGTAGIKQFIAMYRAGMPDTRMVVRDQIAEGARVATHWTGEGTHQGEFMGIAPTGKRVTTRGISLYRLSGGKIVEGYDAWDKLELAEQLGGVPRITVHGS